MRRTKEVILGMDLSFVVGSDIFPHLVTIRKVGQSINSKQFSPPRGCLQLFSLHKIDISNCIQVIGGNIQMAPGLKNEKDLML